MKYHIIDNVFISPQFHYIYCQQNSMYLSHLRTYICKTVHAIAHIHPVNQTNEPSIHSLISIHHVQSLHPHTCGLHTPKRTHKSIKYTPQYSNPIHFRWHYEIQRGYFPILISFMIRGEYILPLYVPLILILMCICVLFSLAFTFSRPLPPFSPIDKKKWKTQLYSVEAKTELMWERDVNFQLLKRKDLLSFRVNYVNDIRVWVKPS